MLEKTPVQKRKQIENISIFNKYFCYKKNLLLNNKNSLLFPFFRAFVSAFNLGGLFNFFFSNQITIFERKYS